MIGQTISHYRIVEKLGEGGMGVVYKAEDIKLKRSVALKFLRTDVLESEEHKTRFLREAQAAAALDHPNICTVYEIDKAEGQTFLSMAFLEGETVKQKVLKRPLKLEEALEIAIQTAQGLQAAHEKGIVHRDIKSANLMVSPQGQVKIMDFGLAQLAERSKLTKTATILGTPAYMSPEQAQRRPTDRRTDNWSLGVVIYEMVTGRLPFEGERQEAVLYAIGNEEPGPITGLRVGVPIELDRIVSKALAKEPHERYQHADEMLVDLRALSKQLESSEPRRAAIKPRRAKTWYVTATIAIAVGVLAATLLGIFSGTQGPQEALVVSPLTTYTGHEEQPSFSPDGNQVAFAWNGEDQNNFDIYVKLLGPGAPLRLTTDPLVDLSPAWSPDGRMIAFVRQLTSVSAETKGSFDVYLKPALGGAEQKLYETDFESVDLQADSLLAWFPNGEWLAVPCGLGSAHPLGLCLVSPETREIRALTSPPPECHSDVAPAFSPDGTMLAFTRNCGFNAADIYLLQLDGRLQPNGQVERLTHSNRWNASPTWMPNGREIIFFSDAPGSGGQLFRLSIDGPSTPKPLWFIGSSRVSLAIGQSSEAGETLLVYTTQESDTNIWSINIGERGQEVLRSPERFLASTRDEFFPAFSPDGRRVAFVSTRSGASEIWICDRDGGNVRQLTRTGARITGYLRWSPGGRHIAFHSRPEGQADIFVVPAEGGVLTQLTTDPNEDVQPSWSRDARWVYFVSRRSGKYDLWKIPSAGGQTVPLTTGGGFTPLESWDGRWLFYLKRPGYRLWKMPLLPNAAEAESVEVIDSVSSGGAYVLFQDGIYFLGGEERFAETLRFLDFSSGLISEVATLDPPATGGAVAVSPDRQTALYTVLEQSGSDLMLLENLR